MPVRPEGKSQRPQDLITKNQSLIREICDWQREHPNARSAQAQSANTLISVYVHELEAKYVPTRNDFESSNPAVFSVNRILNEEARHLVYSGTSFEAVLEGKSVQIADDKFYVGIDDEDSDLVDRLRGIESLYLRIYEHLWPKKLARLHHGERILPTTSHRRTMETIHHLVTILQACPSLKQLLVEFRGTEHFRRINGTKDREILNEGEETAAWLAQPFDRLCGLSDFRIVMDDSRTSTLALADLRGSHQEWQTARDHKLAHSVDVEQYIREHKTSHGSQRSHGPDERTDPTDYTDKLLVLCGRICSNAPVTQKAPSIEVFKAYQQIKEGMFHLSLGLSRLCVGHVVEPDPDLVQGDIVQAWKWMDEGDLETLSRACVELEEEKEIFESDMKDALGWLDYQAQCIKKGLAAAGTERRE